MLQRIGHGIEGVGDPADFGPLPYIHTSGIIAEPPLVRSVDQPAKRAMNEPPGSQPCQDQHQRGAEDDQEDPELRSALHLGEGQPLVEAEADCKPSGVILQRRAADDSLHAVDADGIDNSLLANRQVRYLGAGEPVVFRVAGQVGTVAIRDGERGSRRRTFLSDVVGKPIQAEARHDHPAQAAVVSMKWQGKLNDVPAA